MLHVICQVLKKGEFHKRPDVSVYTYSEVRVAVVRNFVRSALIGTINSGCYIITQ